MRSAGRVIHTLVLYTDIILAVEASFYSIDAKIIYLDSQSVGWLIIYHPTLRWWFVNCLSHEDHWSRVHCVIVKPKMKHFSQTQLCLMNGILQCYMFRFQMNHHQASHTIHVDTLVLQVFTLYFSEAH
jgi:hypothetical protein